MNDALEKSLHGYKHLSLNMEQYGSTKFHCDLELRMAMFIACYIDGTNPTAMQKELCKRTQTLINWSTFYEKLLLSKIENYSSFTLDNFGIAKACPELAFIIYRVITTLCAVDQKPLHQDQKYFLENFRDEFQLTSIKETYQWHQELNSYFGSIFENTKQNPYNNTALSNKDDLLTIDDHLQELNSLVGLENVKSEVEKLISFLKIQKKRAEFELKSTPISLHMVFTGTPGTGKTTVARLIAKIYKSLGFLKKGHLVETDRSGLVGQYVGHTDKKTNEVINQALDGILFIDEAYSLAKGTENDFGQEAIDTLVKRMEDFRDRIVIIVAGYNEEMHEFIESNPGLRSRFTSYIDFENYNTPQLISIFKILCKNNEYMLSSEAEKQLAISFETAQKLAGKNFGNGRFVRNQFEAIVRNQAMRLSNKKSITKKDLQTIEENDIQK